MKPSNIDGWLAFHCFYHASRDDLLRLLVAPVLSDLWRGGLIQSGFFIRYSLGGPHIRLRLKPEPGKSELVRTAVQEASARFFAQHPSISGRDEEAIRTTNRQILANDDDGEDAVYADNSLLEVPFRAEISRYGGPQLLPLTLDLFSISSLAALQFVDKHTDVPAGRRLPAALRLLSRQAVGLAHTPDELLDLSRYAADWSPSFAVLLQRGDQAFDRNDDVFVRMLRAQISHGAGDLGTDIGSASLALGHSIGSASADQRHQIKSSHLHMTANRLGLTNADEVYLGRILSRSIERMRAEDSAALSGAMRTRHDTNALSLSEMVHAAFRASFPAT